jgi:hypothetical protein
VSTHIEGFCEHTVFEIKGFANSQQFIRVGLVQAGNQWVWTKDTQPQEPANEFHEFNCFKSDTDSWRRSSITRAVKQCNNR